MKCPVCSENIGNALLRFALGVECEDFEDDGRSLFVNDEPLDGFPAPLDFLEGELQPEGMFPPL